jgi:hypothetical protein
LSPMFEAAQDCTGSRKDSDTSDSLRVHSLAATFEAAQVGPRELGKNGCLIWRDAELGGAICDAS